MNNITQTSSDIPCFMLAHSTDQSPWDAKCHLAHPLLYSFLCTKDFTTSHHWTLSWASWIQPTLSRRACLRYILILLFHLHLCLQSGLFNWELLAKVLYAILISLEHANCSVALLILIWSLQCKILTTHTSRSHLMAIWNIPHLCCKSCLCVKRTC
jgi:hypothetical protein